MLVEVELAKAESKTEVSVQEGNAGAGVQATSQVWEELQIDRDETLGEDRLQDLNPIAHAQC